MKKQSDRQSFRYRADKRYIAFYKPYGVVSQFTQAHNCEKPTLAEFNFPADVYPLGRLDWDSEGLLLLSDDGSLNAALLHPTMGHERTYLAQVENIPDEKALRALRSGVVLDGAPTLPAGAELLKEGPDLPPRPVPIRFRKNIPTSWIELTLTEGRNRQVRRMTAAVGHPTLRLVRRSIGQLDLFDLALVPSQWRLLDEKQVRKAFAR